MTPNESTVIAGVAGGVVGALVSAVTAVFTTRYVVKHGPNYEARIAEVNATLAGRIADLSIGISARVGELNGTLTKIAQAGVEYLTQQASERQAETVRQLEALWRPDAKIEVQTDASTLTNYLVLKSSQPFELVSVALQASAGATVSEVPITKGQVTTGFRVTIPHQSILKLKQNANAGGLKQGVPGQVAYRVEKGGQQQSFSLPITTEDLFVGNTLWIKLIG